jgi:hypothetical protein
MSRESMTSLRVCSKVPGWYLIKYNNQVPFMGQNLPVIRNRDQLRLLVRIGLVSRLTQIRNIIIKSRFVGALLLLPFTLDNIRKDEAFFREK